MTRTASIGALVGRLGTTRSRAPVERARAALLAQASAEPHGPHQLGVMCQECAALRQLAQAPLKVVRAYLAARG